jgi:hypothetical protein
MLLAPVMTRRAAFKARPIHGIKCMVLFEDVNRHISDPLPPVIDNAVLNTHNVIISINPIMPDKTKYMVRILISFNANLVMISRWQLCSMRR